MSRSAKTILVFGLYLCVLGFILLVTPNTLLGVLGLPLTTEVWIRILGGLVGIAGGYYIQAARHELIPFFRATIWGRLTVLVLLVVFAALSLTPPMIVLFGIIDAIGAFWTAAALRPTSRAA